MNFDIIILGSGSAGYSASIRSSQLGMRTALIEKEFIGGFYFNYECLLKYFLNKIKIFQLFKDNKYLLGIDYKKINIDFYKIFLEGNKISNKIKENIFFSIKKNKINVIYGNAKLKKGKKIEIFQKNNSILECTASNIIISTGSKSSKLYDEKNFINYKEAIKLNKKPKEIVIIGSDHNAIEFASYYYYMGTKISIIDNNNFFTDGDNDVSCYLKHYLKNIGIKIYEYSFIEKFEKKNGKIILKIKNNNKKFSIETDMVLLLDTVPNTDSIGLEELGIQVENKFIVVNENYRTNIPGYYAIGSVINTPSLASIASKEGISCVENIKGIDSQKIDYNNIPKCIFSIPEIAYIGFTEEESKKRKYHTKISKIPFSLLNSSMINESKDGFIKMIFDSKYDELLGCHIIGKNVINLITEIMIARKLEATAYEILNGIYPYPSLSESILESVSFAYKKSIYL